MDFYEGTNARMRRGNSDSMKISGLPLVHGDKIYFTVKNSIYSAEKILQKIVTEFTEMGEAIIQITPQDTRDMNFRDYVYDVQANFGDGKVLTIIPPDPSLPPSKFTLTGEVTYE